MADIQLLDQSTIDKIAAGEVVERPASVVKELLENAVDAGASSITVEIKDGGTSLIRITDNGCGIPASQIRMAFVSHATSKLRNADELLGIASLGFRGEALSSIAAVSKVEAITKTASDLVGTRFCIEGGQEIEMEEIGAPSGTTFLVRDLFYNIPARKKFLKTAMTEANAVTTVVEQLALSHPEISFKYMVNNQLRLHTSGNRNLKELVYQVFGREIAQELIEIHSESDFLKISGFIGKPVISRGNRNFENYYVNGRYVRSKLIAKAIEDGYHTAMMQHRYPFTLLFLEMDRSTVDVNVHPTKMELRFSSQEEIYRQLVQTIEDALKQREQIVHVTLSSEKERAEDVKKEKEEKKQELLKETPAAYTPLPKQNLPVEPNPFGRMPIYPSSNPFASKPKVSSVSIEQASGLTAQEEELFSNHSLPESKISKDKLIETKTSEAKTPEAKTPEAKTPEVEIKETKNPEINFPEIKVPESKVPEPKMPEPILAERQMSEEVAVPVPIPKETPSGEQMVLFSPKFLSEQSIKELRIIGQVFETYFLVEYDGCLYIIDQHAAHEKVNYERMMKNYRKKEVYSQMLNPPLLVSLNDSESRLVERYEKIFTDFGYEISHYGGKDYALNAVPHNLYGIATADLFIEILDNLNEYADKPLEILTNRIASMSCKAAVKGNNKLSTREAEALIRELLTLEDPYHCPHGRPTIISISKREMEKKFKRIV